VPIVFAIIVDPIGSGSSRDMRSPMHARKRAANDPPANTKQHARQFPKVPPERGTPGARAPDETVLKTDPGAASHPSGKACQRGLYA